MVCWYGIGSGAFGLWVGIVFGGIWFLEGGGTTQCSTIFDWKDKVGNSGSESRLK